MVTERCYKDHLPKFDALFNGMPYMTCFGYSETDNCYQLHVIVPQHKLRLCSNLPSTAPLSPGLMSDIPPSTEGSADYLPPGHWD